MQYKQIVFWLTGLSGSGKTTLGKMLLTHIRQYNSQVILLDGDELRWALNCDKYDDKNRKKLAYSYGRLCKLFANQGQTVICCTISMYEEVRSWNRQNIDYYKEIYIKSDLQVLQKRKKLYSKSEPINNSFIIGENGIFEEPANPDIILNNQIDININDLFNELIEKIGQTK